MKKVYNVRLKLKTPLHINAGSGSDGRRFFVSDKIGAYIPATLIKGILRNRMEMNIKAIDPDYKCVGKEKAESECKCVMCRLFGKAGFMPSRVIIDNLLPLSDVKREIRTNVSINRYTKKSLDGALVSSNVISAADNQEFVGNMTVYYTPSLIKYEKALIESFKMIDSIGSSKSRGLGLVEIEVTEK